MPDSSKCGILAQELTNEDFKPDMVDREDCLPEGQGSGQQTTQVRSSTSALTMKINVQNCEFFTNIYCFSKNKAEGQAV